MALGNLDQFQPSFATLDGAVWTAFGPVTPIVRDGRLEANGTSATQAAGVETVDTGVLRNTRVTARMWRGGTAGAVSPRMRFRDAASGRGITVHLDASAVRIGYYDGTLTAQDGLPALTASATFSSATHVWVGVRYDGTTIFLDTSSDGVTWAQRTTLTPPSSFTTNFNANSVHLSLVAAYQTATDVVAFAMVNGAGPLDETAANDTFTGTAGTLWGAHAGEFGATWRGGTPTPPAAQLRLSAAGRLRFSGAGDGASPTVGAAHHLLAGAWTAAADYDVGIRTRWLGTVATGAGTKSFIMPLARGSWDNAEGYTVVWDSTLATPALGLRAVATDGALATVGTDFPFTPVAGTDYEIRLRVSGSSIRVLLDGAEIISGTNTTFAGDGMPGLRAYTDLTNASDAQGQHVDQFFVVPLALPAPGRLAGAAAATLTDTFTGATLDATKWNTAVGGTPSSFGQAGNRLRFVGTAFGQSGLLVSNKYYVATNSSVYVRLYPVVSGSSVTIRLVDAQGRGLYAQNTLSLGLGRLSTARRSTQSVGLSYDATAHAFVRLRVDADGNAFIDTAPEGADGNPGSWTQRLTFSQATQPFDHTAMRFEIVMAATTTGSFTVEADAVNAAVDVAATTVFPSVRRRRESGLF
jgi:hypothetical protein